MKFSIEMFERDVASHQMSVVRDDGVHRHLLFRRPGTSCMHFQVLTWPGYLCYTGDMGTFVFQRLEDMFQFFRARQRDSLYQIDFRYWAEKVEAGNRAGEGDGVSKWDADSFKANVRDYFEQTCADEEEWPADRKAALWEAIESDVCSSASFGEHYAWAALYGFERDGFEFTDWERDCKVWTRSFTWCCHALRWAIATYDDAKSKSLAEPVAATA